MSEQLSLFAAPKLKIPTALNEPRKVDLHRHLLGSVTPAILLDTASLGSAYEWSYQADEFIEMAAPVK